MKIGVISDIHDNINNLEKAIKALNKEKVDSVFFCGDLTLLSIIAQFQKLKAPVKAVFGNRDKDKISILKQIKDNKTNVAYPPNQELIWKFELAGKKMVISHGYHEETVNELIDSGLYDFVFTGHTHSSHIERTAKTLWVNPGSICGWTGLDKKPAPVTLAIVNLKTSKAEIITL